MNNLEYIAKTDVGKKRDHNEDFYGVYPDKGLFFVCDGMGGHAAGDYASHKVSETVIELIKKYSSREIENLILKTPSDVSFYGRLLSSLVIIANRRLFNLAMIYPKLRGMGTTFTAVLFDKGFVNVVNVGDSRVYRFRGNNLTQLSVDHSWVEEMLEDGEIKDTEMDTFQAKNVITRAIGTSPDVRVDWSACDLEVGDIYLLCSDGLCGEIDDNNISGILRNNIDDLDEAAGELINTANQAGGSDNITVILIKIKKKEEVSLLPEEMDKITTLSADKDQVQMIDKYINKYYSPVKTDVPPGVEREKQKIFQNPMLRAILIVLLLFGVMVIIRQPWVKREGVDIAETIHGDIIIRTDPTGAMVNLYFNDELLKKKMSSADFLSLEEGDYKIEIEKEGYEKNVLFLNVERGKQKIRNISLIPQLKLKLSLGISHGFNPSAEIYLNGEVYNLRGSPLTVRRIGIVGKEINITRGKRYKIKIKDAEINFLASEDKDVVKIKLENGKLFIEPHIRH